MEEQKKFPVASKLKKMRTDAGYSRQELGKITGISYRLIEAYEQGKNDINKAQVSTLKPIAVALKCKIDDLID